jgi:hypothetical protein
MSLVNPLTFMQYIEGDQLNCYTTLLSSTPWFSVIFGHSDPLVYGAQARPMCAEPDCCVGHAVETPSAGGTVPAALPSSRWAAHGACDATLRERGGRRVPPCGETARQVVGVGLRGGPQLRGGRGGRLTWRNRGW